MVTKKRSCHQHYRKRYVMYYSLPLWHVPIQMLKALAHTLPMLQSFRGLRVQDSANSFGYSIMLSCHLILRDPSMSHLPKDILTSRVRQKRCYRDAVGYYSMARNILWTKQRDKICIRNLCA